jgi:hypothetical protein
MTSIVAATAKTPLLFLFFKYGGLQTIQDKKCSFVRVTAIK